MNDISDFFRRQRILLEETRMNDMTDSEFLRRLSRAVQLSVEGVPRSDIDRLESIATKHEQMARAVLWAYDEWADEGRIAFSRLTAGELVREATGKHPSDWTRDGLMEWLGIQAAQEESDDET